MGWKKEGKGCKEDMRLDLDLVGQRRWESRGRQKGPRAEVPHSCPGTGASTACPRQ